ncbi:MAG: ATP-dependent helicase [Mitsuaria chitosanitabida]|uniref:ATP-dependent helicase n=1 Tax=Roseateles chitosanitabidus TaxID=65048 RepID=UPI001B282689|nr:ATP-dependent helicase [Roseateles chitosanitabidus]MBO9685463.1 ATP-dependent helicase [Roseateles chitosanitabidus]
MPPAEALAADVAQPQDVYADLNPEQRAAVEHGLATLDRHGPLLVIAGAGSGKTKTLAARVARLIQAGADPQRLLLLTFSRRAAGEMERRAGRMLHRALGLRASQMPPRFPWAGTFHSVGARLLREYAHRIGLVPNFTILDRADAEDLMGWQRQALGLAETADRFPLKGSCLTIYSRVVNAEARLDQVLQEHFPWVFPAHDDLKRLFKAYVEEKQRQQLLDYDDLLLYWSELMSDDTLAAELGERFQHVLVDEYQDTNRLQATLLKRLKPGGDRLTVVGDDAQAIYSFRAAEVRNILEFPTQYDPPARVVALERNYRSTQPILDASNAVIEMAKDRHDKRLWTDKTSSERPQLVTVDDEARQAIWVADKVLERREQGLKLKRQAVLFRTSSHSAPLELELTRRNIPFVKFGGLKFLESTHVKDVLSVLRWAENPRGRLSGFRVAQLLPGFGPASARRLLDEMAPAPDPVQALRDFKPPAAAAAGWAGLRALMLRLLGGDDGGGGLGGASDRWPMDLEEVITWYAPHLERLHDDAPVRQADLEQIARIAQGYGSRERFLTELTLDPPEASSDESGVPLKDEDYLILSTIHSAKGQEWNAVYLLNCVDGCMPSDLSTGAQAQIEEERRLLYVAMTRAKEHLAVMAPQRFYVTQQARHGDRHLYATVSRFLPGKVARHFDKTGPANERQAPLPELLKPALDVAAKLRKAWD